MINRHYLLFSSDKKPGGISTMLLAHVVALIKINNKVTVVLPSKSSTVKYLRDYKKKYSINNDKFRVNTFNKITFFLAKLGLSTFFSEIFDNIDGCFVHNARLIKLAKNYTSKPIFAVNHTSKYSQYKYYKDASLIFSVNKTINKNLISKGIDKNRCVFCPNAILNFPNFNKKNKNDKLIVIGVIGRMVKKKGFDDFIDSIKILKENGYLFRAVIGGDGKLYSLLRRKAKSIKEIEFLGWVNKKEDFYKKVDIFCQPSTFEPFGLTIIEAMSLSIPVVSTDCEGPLDIIDNEKNGFLVPKGDPIAMANTVGRLLRKKSLREKVGKEGRTSIKNNYTIKNLSERLQKNLDSFYSLQSK